MRTGSDTATLQKAKDVVFRLLKGRGRSQKEIYDRLIQKKFPTTIIQQTILYFKKLTLIDDEAFAKEWIQARLLKSYGMHRVQFELQQKGIPKELFEKQWNLLTQNQSEDAIVEDLVQRKLKRYPPIDDQKLKTRLLGYLARKGFNRDIIQKVIKKL